MSRLKTLCATILALAIPALFASAEEPASAKPKAVRVLLVAGAATREYQFVRNLLAREAEQGRARLAIYLQTPPGRTEPREGVVQTGTLLKKFPEVMMRKRTEDLGDQPDEMASYDVVVAFDPDWSQLNDNQQKLLQGWVGDGGGLVLIAGQVNTQQLQSKGAADKFKPVLALYPVVLGDRPLEPGRSSDNAYRLHLTAADSPPAFLKLDPDGKGPLAGWEEFFTGSKEGKKDADADRGFYGAYPIDGVKPAATILATLADPQAKLSDGKEAPFLVASPVADGRVVYIGSGEMWRLRSYRETFHDRFWTGLIRYVAAPTKK